MSRETVVPINFSVRKYTTFKPFYDGYDDRSDHKYDPHTSDDWIAFLYGQEEKIIAGRANLFESVARNFRIITDREIDVAETCRRVAQVGEQIRNFHGADVLERNTFAMALENGENFVRIEELLSGREGLNIDTIKTLTALNRVVLMMSHPNHSDDQISEAIEVAGIRIAKQATRNL